MNEILHCIEHEQLRIVDSRRPSKKEISLAQKKQIERLVTNENIPKNAVSISGDTMKWAQFCGVVQLDDLTIEILPKIYGIEVEDTKRCRNALFSMLQVAKKLKLHRSVWADIENFANSILDVFIIHFCEELKIELAKGIIRKYENREENLSVIKGRLLIEQQLKRNRFRQERMFCSYDELHEDTAANHILKFTLRLLYVSAHSARATRLVNELLTNFASVSDVTITQDTKFPFLDRSERRYESLMSQCKLCS